MDPSPLDHVVWACLSGPHREFAEGTGLALRYGRGYSPIAALAEPSAAAYAALVALTQPGEQISLPFTENHPTPPPWVIELEKPVLQMVCPVPVAERPSDFRPVVLSDVDVPAMLALTELTHPGPFGPFTNRLGTYLGVKIGGRLVAMAGERFAVPGFREISAVCTHPDWQGRGLARLLMGRLAAAMFREGRTPFLHVLEENRTAIGLYERMGFRPRRVITLRVLRLGAAGPGALVPAPA